MSHSTLFKVPEVGEELKVAGAGDPDMFATVLKVVSPVQLIVEVFVYPIHAHLKMVANLSARGTWQIGLSEAQIAACNNALA